MGTKSISQLILDCVQKFNEPMRYRDIIASILPLTPNSSPGSIRTILSNLVKNGLLVIVRYPMNYGYYCKPEWVGKDGLVKPELGWSPYWKTQNKI